MLDENVCALKNGKLTGRMHQYMSGRNNIYTFLKEPCKLDVLSSCKQSDVDYAWLERIEI